MFALCPPYEPFEPRTRICVSHDYAVKPWEHISALHTNHLNWWARVSAVQIKHLHLRRRYLWPTWPDIDFCAPYEPFKLYGQEFIRLIPIMCFVLDGNRMWAQKSALEACKWFGESEFFSNASQRSHIRGEDLWCREQSYKISFLWHIFYWKNGLIVRNILILDQIICWL